MTLTAHAPTSPRSRPPIASAPPRLGPRTAASDAIALALVAGLTLAGLLLRLAAARGDLWLDELWSLDLVSHVTSPDQVFWAISHDNNHFLTSLWIYAIGQGASPLAYRAPSVILGTLTIPVAAHLGWRVNRAAAVAAAALAGCSYPLVDYGSEARGYAGMILASFCAIGLTIAALDSMQAGSAPPRRLASLLALAVALGTCAHFTMVIEAALLGTASVVRLKAAGRSMRGAIDGAFDLFLPAIVLLLPIVAAVGIGILVKGEFTVGGKVPLTPAHWLEGYGGLLGTMLGIPQALPAWIGLLAALGLTAGAAQAGLLDRRFLPLSLVSLLVWPAAALAVQMPNVENARYFLPCGLALLVVLAEVAGRLVSRGGIAQVAGVALVGLVCLGQAQPVSELLRDGRGAPGAAVALIGRDGPTTFLAQPGLNVEAIVASQAARQHLPVTPADPRDSCRHPAGWLIIEASISAPDGIAFGPAECRTSYTKAEVFPSARWSGQVWGVYRRAR